MINLSLWSTPSKARVPPRLVMARQTRCALGLPSAALFNLAKRGNRGVDLIKCRLTCMLAVSRLHSTGKATMTEASADCGGAGLARHKMMGDRWSQHRNSRADCLRGEHWLSSSLALDSRRSRTDASRLARCASADLNQGPLQS